jgi:hypothetical protein
MHLWSQTAFSFEIFKPNLYCQFVYGNRMQYLQAIPSELKEDTIRFTHHQHLTSVKATQKLLTIKDFLPIKHRPLFLSSDDARRK